MLSCATHPVETAVATASQQTPAGKVPDSALGAGTQTVTDGTGIGHRKATLSATATSTRQSVAPNWLNYLTNTQTVQEQLLGLTTLGDVVPPLLDQVPERIRNTLLHQFPTLKRRWDKPDILGPESLAAAKFVQVCHDAGSGDPPLDLVRTIVQDFTWQQPLKAMTRVSLANTLCQHAVTLLGRLFNGPGLFPFSLETVASVCQFLAGHGIHPAIIHQLTSPSGRRRNIMMIPAQDGFFLITHHIPCVRHHIPDYDLMVLGHAGITCREFITRYMRSFLSNLTAMLQLNTYSELAQTYHAEALSQRLECFDAEPANELLSQVTFLISAQTRQKIDGARECDLQIVKMILSSPPASSDEDDSLE